MKPWTSWRRIGSALCALLTLCAGWAQTPASKGLDDGWRWMLDRDVGNCTACHTLDAQQTQASNFGPSLARVGSRYTADELRQWVTDARVIKPDTLMPPYGTTAHTNSPNRAAPLLSPVQISAIVSTLSQLQ